MYVRPFPNADSAPWPISTDGGENPVWARDGSEPFYRGPGGDPMAVGITRSPKFAAGSPRRIFEGHWILWEVRLAALPADDVSADGRQFLMVQLTDTYPHNRINVILNWSEELKKLSAR